MVRHRSEEVERVETYALSVPLARPIADSHARLTDWVVPVVEVSTRDGLTGTGYSGVHTGAELLLQTIDGYFAPLLIGRAPGERRAIWQAMYTSPVQWVGRVGVVQMALGMVDIALWDLAAQRAGVPLWELLGGCHEEVLAYNTDGGWLNRSVEQLVEDMLAMVSAGWFGVKMKLGKPSWREDVERLTAVRNALGPDIWLAVDVNKQWDLTTAVRILPALEQCEVAWIEEPFHPDDVFLHRRFQALTRLPVAVGESLYSRHSFQSFFELDALRIAQIDVTRVGGITEYLEIAAAARAASVPVVPHAGDMVQVHQHLVAAAFGPGPAVLEYLPWTSEIYETPVDVAAGRVVLPRVAGATTAVRPEARRKFSISGVGQLSK
ncbi:MAG TPA: mandelate racemase/muconate lactonizing enzyme family protein [Acidimicrobiales bacterium]|nr:mandelate racemase/muconate lactonizing enzyme family protein [Acidimicrobiales bacterium]